MQVEVVNELVALGVNPAVQDAVASTPMHVAAGEGHVEAILALQRLVCLIALACSIVSGYTSFCMHEQASAWNGPL